MSGNMYPSNHPQIPPTAKKSAVSSLRLLRSKRVGPANFCRMIREHGSAAAALAALPEIAAAAGVTDYPPPRSTRFMLIKIRPRQRGPPFDLRPSGLSRSPKRSRRRPRDPLGLGRYSTFEPPDYSDGRSAQCLLTRHPHGQTTGRGTRRCRLYRRLWPCVRRRR